MNNKTAPWKSDLSTYTLLARKEETDVNDNSTHESIIYVARGDDPDGLELDNIEKRNIIEMPMKFFHYSPPRFVRIKSEITELGGKIEIVYSKEDVW